MVKLRALIRIRLNARLEYRADLVIGFIADLAMSGLGLVLLFALLQMVYPKLQ